MGDTATIRLTLLFTAALALLASSAACRKPSEYFGKVEPPRDNVFRFSNESEPEYIDPGLMVGQPDVRIAQMLFEGLTVNDPRTNAPIPGVADRWEVSTDQKVYTFHLRPNAVWSDGAPVTARDFVYAWTRVLDPKTAARYASQLYDIVNAQAFNEGKIKDPSQLGIASLDDFTLQVRLRQPVPYFLSLTAMFTFSPVPRKPIEEYGDRWTEPGHIVGNGPFVLVAHKANSKFELARNPRYWDAGNVSLDHITAYSVDDNHSAANLYESGMVDWLPSNDFPAEYTSYLRAKFKDLHSAPFLGILYYSFNTTRPPLNNPLVRRALSMAIDRRAITNDLLKGGETPTSHFVPIGMPGYESPPGWEYDPQRAAALLAQAGYPNGRGFPPLSILFNINESRKRITESVQQMWARNLNIHVSIYNQEWGSYLKSLDNLDYDIGLQAWVGDYPDPTTFTDLLETGNGNNRTGWSNAAYDRLLARARQEPDASKRMGILHDAEALMLSDAPVLPVYTYASNDLIKPYVRGIFSTPLDMHLMNRVSIDRNWRGGEPVEGARR